MRAELDDRQLPGAPGGPGGPGGAGWSWRCRYHLVLEMRDKLGEDFHQELMLGGNALADKLIDLGHRGWPSVELALTRLRLRPHALPPRQRVLFLRRHGKLDLLWVLCPG